MTLSTIRTWGISTVSDDGHVAVLVHGDMGVIVLTHSICGTSTIFCTFCTFCNFCTNGT